MRTVVPIGGKVTPALLLGWAPADFSAAEVECVAVALAAADDGDVDDPELDDDDAVLWVAVPEAAPVVELELDDPPHAVSSNSSEPSPATAHPLLRMASLFFLPAGPVPGPDAVCPGLTYRT